MSTIESRLAALEKLYADKSLELATCRLDVELLKDIHILVHTPSVTGDECTEFSRKSCGSEPTSAAARQLLGLPVQDVRMQEDEPTDAPIDWLQATHTVSGKPVYDLVLRPQGDIYGRVGDEADGNVLRWFPTTGRCCEAPFSGSDLRKPEPSTKPKQREYPALRWDNEGYFVSTSSKIRFGYVSLHKPNTSYTAAFWHNGGTNSNFFDTRESARQWVETQFREWFDSLFDQPKNADACGGN